MAPDDAPEHDLPDLSKYETLVSKRLTNWSCPACGTNEWFLSNELSFVPSVTSREGDWGDWGMGLLVYVCTNCAYIRSHSTRVLEQILEAEGPGDADDGDAGDKSPDQG